MKEERFVNKRLSMKIGALGAMALMLLVAFAGTNTVANGDETPCNEYKDVKLWAGQNIHVGTVKVWHDDVYLYVKYVLFDDVEDCGWYITESHLSVAVGTWEDHPQGKKNLKLGQFEFTDPDDEEGKYHYYEILWTELDSFDWGKTLDIVAHAVVLKVCDGETVQGETAYGEGKKFWKNWAMSFRYKPCNYKMPSIPTGQVRFKVFYPGTSTNSYFRTVIYAGEGGDVPGDTDLLGWCIDLGHTISSNTFYSGYLSMPAPGDDDFCKWNKVNWILNNKDSHSWEVIQAAIWHIWIDEPIDGNMGSGSVTLTGPEIVEAQAFADEADTMCSFRAFSGDWVAVILTPTSNNQITIIEIDP